MTGPRKGYLKNSALLVFSLCISLLLAEAMVRVIFPQNLGTWGMTRDGITSHVPNLNVYVSQFKQVIKTNSHGMRDREHAVDKESGIFRILLLGDSFMEANQVSYNESFAHLLEAQLGPHVEVVNASVSGWGTDDELTYLMRYGFHFQPDLVLVGMTLHNDIQDNLAEEFHSLVSGALQEKPRQDIPIEDYSILQIKEFLASRSHLYQLLLRAKRFSWAQHEGERLSSHVASLVMKEPSEEVERGWDMTQKLFRKMSIETKKHGAKLIVFLIPLWVQVSGERLEQFLMGQGLSIDQIVLEQPQLTMRAISREEGFDLIDLLQNFKSSEQREPRSLYLIDDGHWTARGHRLAAVLVAEQLKSKVLKNVLYQ